MTPPAAARLTRIPVKTIRAWARTGRIPKRIKNRSADPKQQKYLVNVDDVLAVAEQVADVPSETSDKLELQQRAQERAAQVLAACASKERWPMAFVYRHPRSSFWWMCWVDSQGREQRASSKTRDQPEAKATADELERRARVAEGHRAPAGSLTVERFFDETWLPLRQKIRPWQWKADRAALRTHFLPLFGSRAIADLATDDGEVSLLDWVIALREHPSQRDGTPIASRTVRNIASCVRMFFADATERKVVRRNPTIGWDADRHLPPIEDKERGWRARAGFSLDQVVTLTTDRRIPGERRVLYAMRFLGGPRPGEAANARWRNLDRTKRPLWRLTLESSFNSPMRREKGTKTGAELNIPVHPVLQQMLERWEASGWEEFMGRDPEPDDLILPRSDGKQRLVVVSRVAP
jgi:integrase